MSLNTKEKITLFWFRRDLRLHDNAGLYYALRSENPVVPVFIFDKTILDDLDNKEDKRLTFIHQNILEIQRELQTLGADILVFYGHPTDVWQELSEKYDIAEVFTNTDYEPYATERDTAVAKILRSRKAELKAYKDQVIFEKQEILSGQNTPYTVFTPYSRMWREKCNDFYLSSYPNKKYFKNFLKWGGSTIPSLQEMGFKSTDTDFPSSEISAELLENYETSRDFPAMEGTSRIGIHLRFGTVSIRELARFAKKHSNLYLNELIWREFYQQILSNFPHVGKGKAFRAPYDDINWGYDKEAFQKWCDGKTGYPLVDAGMRQMNAIGFMHNRVRMVVASFLAKHLLLNWRLGEAYFAEKLLDYDLAANNGGWQWAVGSGTDAAPYFRIFNPEAQAKKFDPKGEYIKKWVPEFGTDAYPEPMVDHKMARERCLREYKKALDKS
ncbi:cryptochrome/photolyase family protein [Dyadobacter fanqingshengii]|uniref:DNA photolyase family protein n=1 Tax=Dyadobacter fanqingshengii TaxID=2906443 RepID=A0A9X1P6B5_9BACT|nr:deoxyribodipyrimidine photo-lyase [Dyadobacter fanqingshengii]MCF0038762.1 DNA photolyase family protein [Dyadobacter fanqingshengii]USJ34409.1 DNA photolyase family protein [Dyadobacter fanqingshengii]